MQLLKSLNFIKYFIIGLLLTNYRCHDSILRLPSNLFFKSTLQVRTNSKLHPKTASALEFVCTSIDSTITTSSQDYSEEEARTTLEQVSKGLVIYMLCLWSGLICSCLSEPSVFP